MSAAGVLFSHSRTRKKLSFPGRMGRSALAPALLALALLVQCPLGSFAADQNPQKPDDLRYVPPSGPKGFSSNPFSLQHRDQAAPKPTVRYVDGKKEVIPSAGASGGEESAVAQQPASGPKDVPGLSLSVRGKEQPDRLTPDRNAFPGGEHTLSREDTKRPAEMSVNYKLNDNTSTSLTLNPQDEGSPLTRTAGQDEGINSAGVYMHMEVQPNLQMKVGGEYGQIESRYSPREDTTRGAAVGVEWSF